MKARQNCSKKARQNCWKKARQNCFEESPPKLFEIWRATKRFEQSGKTEFKKK
jgi:hypothetical protein